METLKKTIVKFFYLEFIWVLLPLGATFIPIDKVSSPHLENGAANQNRLGKEDMKFILVVSEGNMMEIKLGELAQNSALSNQVKKIGKIMIEDHHKTNRELTVIANAKQIVLAGTLNKKQLKKYNKIAKKKGADFDKAYIEDMIENHKKDISVFEKETKDGTDPEIKNWASNKLAMLKHHLYLANEANAVLKK